MGKKTYRVTGSREVHGVAPGKTFEAELDQGAEAALIEGGHITESKAAKPDEKVASEAAAAGGKE